MGECGCGKTDIALGSIFTSTKKKAPITVVMCPGHIVEKWKRETLRMYPLARAVIATDLSDIVKLEQEIKNRKVMNPLFIIMSKDTSKITYEKRPSAMWDAKREVYYDPTHPKAYNAPGSLSNAILNMLKINNKNSDNPQARRKEYHYINRYREFYNKNNLPTNERNYMTKLWVAANPDEETVWVKVPGSGWVNKDTARTVVRHYDNYLVEYPDKPLSKECMKAYSIAKAALSIEKSSVPKRYSMAAYIRRMLKGYIDYFIADEVHQYASPNSDQSRAFTDLVLASKQTLALTGTLVNGYVENLFFLLYRLYPRMLKAYGFSYNDSKKFVEQYGFFDEISETQYNTSNTYRGNDLVKRSKKYKPGISPQVFSNFLLDKAVCVSLTDMTKDLPNYHQITVPVTLSAPVQQTYNKLMEDFRQVYTVNRITVAHANAAQRANASKFGKTIFKAVRLLSNYPDQPYNQFPVFDNDTNTQVLIPENAQVGDITKYSSEKDMAAFEIARRHLDGGEKVLIYLDQVNKLDCKDRLLRLFKQHGIKAAFLSSEISALKREEWIMKQLHNGIQVLICNPSLVETGLDLLDFTTIIFYQTAYNLYTVRQSSRRSLRLNQDHSVNVYFLYYKNTVQENIMALMANKMQAAMAIEGKFTAEGLNAMSQNDTILTQIASNLSKNIEDKLNDGVFDFNTIKPEESNDDHFKEENDFVSKWYYAEHNNDHKFKRQIFNMSDELLALKAG